jgi:hypothetical protein
MPTDNDIKISFLAVLCPQFGFDAAINRENSCALAS